MTVKKQILKNKFFRIAKEAMEESPCKVRVGACLVVGNGIIIAAHNHSDKTHPLMKKYYPNYVTAIHAELSACIAYNPHLHGEFRCAKMYVYREDKHGNVKKAKPCKGCQKALKAFGIKKVMYSLEDGIGELIL